MSRERLQQLLKAIGSAPKEDAAQDDAVVYNWQEPHYFNKEQLARLGDFADEAASGMSREFANFCRGEFDVTISSTTQHYVYEILSRFSDGEQQDYYLPFAVGGEHMCGLIGMPGQTAVNWATQLLGDSESEKDPGENLSQLEESLLLDLASALIEVFSGRDKALALQPAQNIARGSWPFEPEGSEEILKISFEVKKADSEKISEAYFLILCSKLTPITGSTAEDSDGISTEDIPKAILGHMQEIPVLITSKLASAVLSFEELMNLQADDILLLDKKVDQPVELILDDRTVYYGRPAKSAGKYAVTITNTATAFRDTA